MDRRSSERARIAHLHRRFGFGATPEQLDQDQRLGVRGTLERILSEETVDVWSPFEFSFQDKAEPDLGAWRFRSWWVANMLATPSPFREKMAIFWHSHFAVSDGKVEDGPMMLSYLQTLRREGLGRFGDLVLAVAKEPAMMRYLDMERAVSGRPNENFARELMELFTLGIGSYTESDVKELARALTGWGYLNAFWEMPGNTEQKLLEAMDHGRLFASFIEMPALRDPKPKTILGQARDWSGDDAVRMLARRPETARHLALKLWAFFGSDQEEPAAVARIAAAFERSGGDIKATLRAMAACPEFWSERTVTKSPADFCIGFARTQGIGTALVAMRAPKAMETTPVPHAVLEHAGTVAWRMERMGLNLFWPADVSGWKTGSAWATPSAMAERMQFHGQMIWGDKRLGEGALTPRRYVVARGATSPRGVADALCELFDMPLPDPAREAMAKTFGDMACLDQDGLWADKLNRMLRLMVAAPEAHLA